MAVKGVIIAAGYGTRFLPITRAVPKEMLPIIDRPSIDLVVREMVDAGIDDILVITSRRKKVLEDWFDWDPELRQVLERDQARDTLERVRPTNARVCFVRQREMLGTGHALLLARSFAGDDPVIVAYPDDLFGSPNLSTALIDVWTRTGCSVLSALDCSGTDVSRYGVLDLERSGGELRVRTLVEKPPPGQEPSSVVSMGRYLFTPEIFERLAEHYADHSQGEFYPQDAINGLASEGRVVAHLITAPHYDTGTPLAWLCTNLEFALNDPDLGPELRVWLSERLG